MKLKLALKAAVRFLSGLVIMLALIFIPAGTLNHVGAWRLIAVLFLPMLIFGILLLVKAPKQLENRLRSKEVRPEQTKVIIFCLLLFLLGFILAGLDYRFGWSRFPDSLSVIATIVMLLSYFLYMEVVRENAYLSRTVEIQDGQKLIDTGLYSIVRHPLYTATLLIFLSTPLILCSYYAFAVFLLFIPIMRRRIVDEEKMLEQELDGYTEYKARVKYRLLPYIW